LPDSWAELLIGGNNCPHSGSRSLVIQSRQEKEYGAGCRHYRFGLAGKGDRMGGACSRQRDGLMEQLKALQGMA